MTDKRENYNAPEGVEIIPGILIQIQNYWGRGKTIGAAWKSVVAEAGRTVAFHKKNTYLVFSVLHYKTDNDETTVFTYVNEMGGLNYHKDYPPHLIDQKK